MPKAGSPLSLRLSTVFVAMLIAAALAVGYLFDRGRTEALEQREIEHLRQHAERGADEVDRFIKQLRADVLFLADIPPIQGIRRALEAGDRDPVGDTTLEQWQVRLQQIFLSFAATRPEYFQLRLISAHNGGQEIVRIERTTDGLRTTPPEALTQKGERYYVREASESEPGTVYLSRVDLNRERGLISIPHRPTLRAATPIPDPSGDCFAVVVINMDMEQGFNRAASFSNATESLYIADERGDILLHPEPGHAFGFEFDTPFRLANAFPGHAQRITDLLSDGGSMLEIPGPEGGLVAYLTVRTLDPQQRLIFILTKPVEQLFRTVGLMRRESLVGMGGLLLLATALVVVMVRRLTRSLSALAKASEAIAGGDYRVALPKEDGLEVENLALAFRHMATEVERREEALAELNRDLELRVEQRTRELAREHRLQHLILENIADGIVVSDLDGKFVLWNRKAEQMIGANPSGVPQQQWSSHFGVFRDESGDPVPVEELPLVKAIREASAADAELYLRNPQCTQGKWVQVTARPLHDAEGGISGGVAVLVDVTEQKHLQGRLQRHSTKLAKVGRLALSTEIASSVAHQLSQPIAAMSNYASAAVRLRQQGRLGEEELTKILTQIERLSIQAGKILDKLRARIRRHTQPAVPVDVNQIAASCLDLLRDRLERQGVRVEHHYGQRLPTLLGDPIGLEQLLVQLVLNALEAMEGTERSKRRLSISTNHDTGAHLVMIEIGDTGPGVSAALAERLFDPWETNKPGALGIGLSIAQTIVESFEGRIRMGKTDADGTLFHVELPVAQGTTA